MGPARDLALINSAQRVAEAEAKANALVDGVQLEVAGISSGYEQKAVSWQLFMQVNGVKEARPSPRKLLCRNFPTETYLPKLSHGKSPTKQQLAALCASRDVNEARRALRFLPPAQPATGTSHGNVPTFY